MSKYKPIACSTAFLALTALSAASQAAVVTYQIQYGSEYWRNGMALSGMPVIEASANVLGTMSVDTTTGELLAMSLNLGTYEEKATFTNYYTDYAIFEFDEQQSLAASIFGVIAGDQIAFSGVDLIGSGTSSCVFSTGANGNAACGAPPSVSSWSGLDFTLMLSPDDSMFTISATWDSSVSGIETSHNLDIFAVREVQEVPLPGAALFMFSGLTGLLAMRQKSA